MSPNPEPTQGRALPGSRVTWGSDAPPAQAHDRHEDTSAGVQHRRLKAAAALPSAPVSPVPCWVWGNFSFIFLSWDQVSVSSNLSITSLLHACDVSCSGRHWMWKGCTCWQTPMSPGHHGSGASSSTCVRDVVFLSRPGRGLWETPEYAHGNEGHPRGLYSRRS